MVTLFYELRVGTDLSTCSQTARTEVDEMRWISAQTRVNVCYKVLWSSLCCPFHIKKRIMHCSPTVRFGVPPAAMHPYASAISALYVADTARHGSLARHSRINLSVTITSCLREYRTSHHRKQWNAASKGKGKPVLYSASSWTHL